MQENPGAYNEARNRIREQKEKEKLVAETLVEHFEKSKEKLHKRKWLDIYELKRKIETGHSLESLKSDIREALKDGDISIETYNQALSDISERDDREKKLPEINPDTLPFSQNELAQWLDKQPLGKSIWADMVGFLYGFFVQGSAILVIIAWKILMDLLKLPMDVYNEIQDSRFKI
jgi:signal recognition particle GTPase